MKKNQNNLFSFRRSVYAKKNISKNEKFSNKNIICLRPYMNNSSINFLNFLKKSQKKL